MPLKIRLRQQGRVNKLAYRLVVADSRSPRDGKYLEKLGHYDPHLPEDKDGSIREDRVVYWIKQGAQLSDKARAFVLRKALRVMKNLRNSTRKKPKELTTKMQKEK